jgi:hypothetical protein
MVTVRDCESTKSHGARVGFRKEIVQFAVALQPSIALDGLNYSGVVLSTSMWYCANHFGQFPVFHGPSLSEYMANVVII